MNSNNLFLITVISSILCVVQNAQSNSFDYDQTFTMDAQKSSWAEAFVIPKYTISGFRFASDGFAITNPEPVGLGSGDSTYPDYWGWKNVTLVSSAYQSPDRTFNLEYTTANAITANRQLSGTSDGIVPPTEFGGDPKHYDGSVSLKLTTAPDIANGIEDAPSWRRFLQSTFGQFVTVQSDSPAPVPEPATMLLFGTGLAGLAGMVVRRRKK